MFSFLDEKLLDGRKRVLLLPVLPTKKLVYGDKREHSVRLVYAVLYVGHQIEGQMWECGAIGTIKLRIHHFWRGSGDDAFSISHLREATEPSKVPSYSHIMCM